jgi:hypothetical protein
MKELLEINEETFQELKTILEELIEVNISETKKNREYTKILKETQTLITKYKNQDQKTDYEKIKDKYKIIDFKITRKNLYILTEKSLNKWNYKQKRVIFEYFEQKEFVILFFSILQAERYIICFCNDETVRIWDNQHNCLKAVVSIKSKITTFNKQNEIFYLGNPKF